MDWRDQLWKASDVSELDPEMQSFFENEVAAVRERVKTFGVKRSSAVELIFTLLLIDMEIDERGPLLAHLRSIYPDAGKSFKPPRRH